MPGVAETFKSVIDEMTYGSDFKLINLLQVENVNLTDEDLTTSFDQLESQWNIHIVLYDTLTSRAKPSRNGQLSHCSWSIGMFDRSYRYKTKNSVGWRFVINVRIGFKLQATTIPGFHSLYDCCFQTMWVFSGALDDLEDETWMEQHGTEALNSTVKSLMHAFRTEAQDAKQDATYQMIQIAKPWIIRRWSESKLGNG
jgi:hypothetical protein